MFEIEEMKFRKEKTQGVQKVHPGLKSVTNAGDDTKQNKAEDKKQWKDKKQMDSIRTKMLIGTKGLEHLAKSKVCLFGLGGVGGFIFEALVRSGVGSITVIDKDIFDESNLNRQLLSTEKTVGLSKVDCAIQRAKEIDPICKIDGKEIFYLPETKDSVDLKTYDYVIDAVDTVTAKLLIVEEAKRANVPVISCMGTGNRLDPSQLKVADIYETSNCGLARQMRKELRKRGVSSLTCVYSTEPALEVRSETLGNDASKNEASDTTGPGDVETTEQKPPRKDTPGSMIFVPAAAGMLIASVVVRELQGGPSDKQGV